MSKFRLTTGFLSKSDFPTTQRLGKVSNKLGLSCAKLSTCWDQFSLKELVKFAIRYYDEVMIKINISIIVNRIYRLLKKENDLMQFTSLMKIHTVKIELNS